MIQSEGDQSLVVTICLEVCLLQTTPNCCQTSFLVIIGSCLTCCFAPNANCGPKCIAKEAELMYNYLPCDFDTTEEVAVCNKVRRSALNLMLYKGSESAVAAGAMMVCS